MATPQRRRVVAATPRRPRARLESVRVVVGSDPSPDPSYLDQDELEDRRAAYDRGEFNFVYVRAEADVVIEDLVQTLTSGGLYGIESDSEKEYFLEVAGEEWRALRDVLKTVGVPTTELPLDVDRAWIDWRM